MNGATVMPGSVRALTMPVATVVLPWPEAGAAMTTRGMKEEEMMQIADYIHTALTNRADEGKLASLRKEVTAFTAEFPLP